MHATSLDPETNMPAFLPWWKARLAAWGRGRTAYVLVSLLLLTPCYWQPRIQAGDLSSHIYNAWLAQLVESGRAQGLLIVSQTTNILFDLILSGLFRILGAEAAQRIAVSLAVLIFVWGGFAFISAASGRRVWYLMPCIAMLAYGWVFHMGFFNFYLSLGLCLWALATAWGGKPWRLAATAPILALAYVAHALPVIWTLTLLAYLWWANRLKPFGRACVTTASLLLMILLHVAVRYTMFSRWSLRQLKLSTGADQVSVFDAKYYLVLIGLLLIWGLLFLGLLRHSGPLHVASSIPFQFCVISAAAVVILPTTVLLPSFHHTLVYVAERMSLGVGVCVCALLGVAKPRVWERYGLVVLALIFFVFLYRDERTLNSFEDRMEGTVAQLAPGQRVVSAIDDPYLHVNALTHVIDRVCLGRCFSYANYEPSTAQFRVRTAGENPFVISDYEDSWKLQNGKYKAKEAELPIFQVDMDRTGRMVIRSLKAGAPCGSTYWKALQDPPPNS